MACAGEDWHLKLWDREQPRPEKPTEKAFKCRSWRHRDGCDAIHGKDEAGRLRVALQDVPTQHILFLVLTLDGRSADEPRAQQFRGLVDRWRALQRLIEAGFAETGFPAMGAIDYASYVEAHRSGRPHLNVVIVSPALAKHLREHPHTEADERAAGKGGGRRAPSWFRGLAAHAGWGPLASLDHVRSKGHVTNYVTKVKAGSVEHPALVGEVTKLSQLPYGAPKRFRRVRSSRGFLPPRRKRSDMTGEIAFHPTEQTQRQRQAIALEKLRDHFWGPGSARSLRARAAGQLSVPANGPTPHELQQLGGLPPAQGGLPDDRQPRGGGEDRPLDRGREAPGAPAHLLGPDRIVGRSEGIGEPAADRLRGWTVDPPLEPGQVRVADPGPAGELTDRKPALLSQLQQPGTKVGGAH